MQKELLKKYYDRFLSLQANYTLMFNYYDGKHAITNDDQYVLENSRANYRVVLNYIKKFCTNEIGFILGNEPSYISKTQDLAPFNKINDKINANKDAELLKFAEIYGKAWGLFYYNSKGQFSVLNVAPSQGYAIKDSFGDITAFIRVSEVENPDDIDKLITTIDVYEGANVETWKMDGEDGLTLVKESSLTGFPSVPVSELVVPETFYELIKGVNDSINILYSNAVNESASFRSALLGLAGATIEDEYSVNEETGEPVLVKTAEAQMNEIFKSGVIQLPEGADAKYITKTLDSAYTKLMLEQSKTEIHELASQVSSQDMSGGTVSGDALRTRMTAMKFRTTMTSNSLQQYLQDRAYFINHSLDLKGVAIDVDDVEINITLSLPTTLSSEAEFLFKIWGKVSKETAWSQLSFIADPLAEKKRFDKELEEDVETLTGVVE